MPKIEEMDKGEVLEVTNAAKDYLASLKTLVSEVTIAEKQIEISALETEKYITSSFTNLLDSLIKTLNERREHLLKKILKVKDTSLKPLRDCHAVILSKIEKTVQLVALGEKIINNNHKCNITEFNNSASFLGSLPEVPELKEVPCISGQFDSTICKDLVETCSALGSVSSIAPVQISTLIEKPGSILVEWHVMESEDKLKDIQEFRLQKAYGHIADKELTVNFNDCYIGPDFQYLVKDLQHNQPYSFRVCCKFEGGSTWSSWSIPQIWKTSIKPYNWEHNDKFSLRNERKIAKPIADCTLCLFSDGPQFHAGYSVEFTFLECDNNLNKTYVGISYTNNVDSFEDLMSDSFLVETNGNIYINGAIKSTRLPAVNVGSKICFTCELLHDTKILINVDSGDKRVTYDWMLSSNDVLYFFVKFNSTKWKIMVE